MRKFQVQPKTFRPSAYSNPYGQVYGPPLPEDIEQQEIAAGRLEPEKKSSWAADVDWLGLGTVTGQVTRGIVDIATQKKGKRGKKQVEEEIYVPPPETSSGTGTILLLGGLAVLLVGGGIAAVVIMSKKGDEEEEG